MIDQRSTKSATINSVFFNQSIKIYIAPLQDSYSEAHPKHRPSGKEQFWEGGEIESKLRVWEVA